MSSISLQDFLQNFSVRVVEYKTELNSIITVHYEVRCIINNRLSIHIASVDVSELEEYTSADVLDLAWDEVKTNVTNWATTNISNPPLINFTPQTSTGSISLTDLNNNFSISISRWELYPKDRPSSWCIGFLMTKNGADKKKYLDCSIPFTNLCNNTLCLDIITAAWDVIKPSFCAWAAEVLLDDVVNSIYTPANLATV